MNVENHLRVIWHLARRYAGESMLSGAEYFFLKGSFEREACAMAYKTYVDIVDARERELGGFDP